LLLQAPVASQVPAQRPVGSAWLVAALHMCEVESHCWQTPDLQSLLVQQPSAGMQVVVLPIVQPTVFPEQV
jgi:hypothetical protein